MPSILIAPWSRLRRPVPAASAPHGLQLAVVPIGTLALAGSLGSTLEPFATARLVSSDSSSGAFQLSVTVFSSPAARSPTAIV